MNTDFYGKEKGDAGSGRIDIHHHYCPPQWLSHTKARGLSYRQYEEWSVERSLADMDAAGVDLSILSVSTPSINYEDIPKEWEGLARDCNEYGADLVRAHPRRFGLFATLPMMDVDASLREVEYALDTLNAEGICLMTSCPDREVGDRWLGDPIFEPLMAELDRRHAVVYVHPHAPNCCCGMSNNLPVPMIEYGTDTTRAIAALVFNGVTSRLRNIRWIFSHAGGTMPFLIERFRRHAILNANASSNLPNGLDAELGRLHFDTAQAANNTAMTALKSIVPVSQILLGTDYPFRKSIEYIEAIRNCGAFNSKEIEYIESHNAKRVLGL